MNAQLQDDARTMTVTVPMDRRGEEEDMKSKGGGEAERAGLREAGRPGTTVYTVLRHVSRSGMYRVVAVYLLEDQQEAGWQPREITGRVAAVLGRRYDKRHEGIGVSGCGMDAGFEIVYELGRALWPGGVPCTGSEYSRAGRLGCQSNAHSNGERAYRAGTVHEDGGYAYRQAWL